jgi:hypothetical protein
VYKRLLRMYALSARDKGTGADAKRENINVEALPK